MYTVLALTTLTSCLYSSDFIEFVHPFLDILIIIWVSATGAVHPAWHALVGTIRVTPCKRYL